MTGKAIYAILSTAVPVTGIVSTRIYPDMATQDATYPFVVYSITGILPSNTKDHASQMDEVTASVICYADSYNSVQDLSEKVRAALDGKTRGTYGGVSLQSIRITDQISTQMNIDKLVYIVDQTYQIRQNR